MKHMLTLTCFVPLLIILSLASILSKLDLAKVRWDLPKVGLFLTTFVRGVSQVFWLR